MAFNEIWNHPKQKAARRINKLVTEVIAPLIALNSFLVLIYSSRLTYTHHHDLNSRPRQFNPTTHQPACTHTRNPSLSSSPLRLMIIRFPSFLHVSPALSPLVFTIIFLTFFSTSVSIFACLTLWFWFPPVYQPTIDHIMTHSIGFSLIHLALVSHPDRLILKSMVIQNSIALAST